MDPEQIQQQKKQFRKRINEILKSLTPDEIARQSSVVSSKVIELPEYRDARSLSVFLSMPGKEISTQQIVRQAFRDGKKVYVPYIHASRQNSTTKIMDMLRLRDEDDLDSLEPDAWGIPSLSKNSVDHRENALGGKGCLEEDHGMNRGTERLDLIFMPSTAFDSSHNRLGHGKGFYDRYLTLCQFLTSSEAPGHKLPHLIGLALKEQMLPPGEELPTTELDWRVDRVITSED